MSTAPELPDFCRPQAVLLLVLLGLLLAVLLALATEGLSPDFWRALGLTALMIETVVLAACLVLCAGRGVLERMPRWLGHVTVFLVLQALTLAASLMALDWFLLPGASETVQHAPSWLLRNLLISAIASLLLLRYLALHRQWQQQVRAEADARLNALQARIRPHFLFNTLNTIASLIRSRPDEAEEAVLDLSDLLRTGLRDNPWHRLDDELDLVRGYLRIEAQRLGPRLAVDWQLADNLPGRQAIPALLIQPLVENAIVHGIARAPDGGRLRIEGTADARQFRIRVRNALPPVDDAGAGAHGGQRMAIDNIRQRVALAYGERARFHVFERGGEFVAELELPRESDAPV